VKRGRRIQSEVEENKPRTLLQKEVGVGGAVEGVEGGG
jgi:hypothetical protein